jgi:cell division protein FtsQ
MQVVKILFVIMLAVLFFWEAGRQVISKKVNESMPIRYVRTEGIFQYLSKDEIKSSLSPYMMGNIFDVDVQAIQEVVSDLPWVKSAKVQRVWPDTIDIKVQERKAYVRWGSNSLLTENGELFTPNHVEQFKSLIFLDGPKDQEAKTLEIMKGVNTALEDQALTLREFAINSREAWTIKLNNGLRILLGRSGQLLKLQRFLDAIPVIGKEKMLAMDTVDLRYPNGFAVSWRPDAGSIDWTGDKTAVGK